MLVNVELFSEIEISKLFENKLNPILQLVEIFTNSLNIVWLDVQVVKISS